MSLNCEFGALREDLVRDIFTCGLSQKMGNIRERLLAEGNITLEKAVSIAKAIAIAKENALKLEDTQDDEPFVNMIRRKSSTYNKQQNTICTRCGQTHKNRCPAEGAKCHNCGKSGHFAKMCFVKKRFVKNINVKKDGEDEDDDEEEEDLFIGAISKATKTTATEWNIELKVDNNRIKCQVDTGAQANIISKEIAKKLNFLNLLKNTVVNIFTFSGEKLAVLGTIKLSVVYENETHILKFFVVDMKCKNIIGIQSAIDMNLIKNVNILTLNNIIEKYSDVFSGIGLLYEECDLQIRQDISPVVEPPRKIPFKLYDGLKTELVRMESLNIN